MSNKNKKQDTAKSTQIGESKSMIELSDSIKSVAGEFKGGLGSLVTDHLKQEEKTRLSKKIVDLGVKAHTTHKEIVKCYHSIKEGDIVSYVSSPTEDDDLATVEVKNFSAERAKLRPRAKKTADALAKAIDAAYVSANEDTWNALNGPINEANKLIADVKKHLGSKKD